MKLTRILFSITLVVGLMVSVAAQANALQLKSAQVNLSDTRQGQAGVTHTFTWTNNEGGDLVQVNFQYCHEPSGTCDTPSGLTTTTATKGTLTGFTNAYWSLNSTTGGMPRLQFTSGGGTAYQTLAGGSVVVVPIAAITNSSITNDANDCQASDGDSSSDTCYVRISTCAVYGCATTTDTGTVSYTVVVPTVVTARVDPTFTFVVQTVGASTVNNGVTTSVASTFNTLPFGNLTAGTPKYAAHKLNVTTNTQGGYYVTMRMLNQMIGVYTGNNIDPFSPTVAGFGWNAPASWTEPTGTTPNTNTSWIGANTTDVDVESGAYTTALFGPVDANAHNVMQKSSTDDGTAPVYVTYALEANTFQPADTYTGTLLYNALPTY